MRPLAGLGALPVGTEVRVAGRLVAREGSGARLADEGVAIDLELVSEAEAPVGAWVAVVGRWETGRLVAREVTTLEPGSEAFARGESDWSRLQAGVLERLRVRAEVLRGIRRFMREHGLLEVETPLAVPSPGLDLHLDAIEVRHGGRAGWLATSPEYQMKRLIAAGSGPIYQLGKAFRRGEEGPLHQPELTLLEWYRPFAGSAELMEDTERLVAYLARELSGAASLPGRGRSIDVSPPWPRLTVAEAFARHASRPLEAVLPDEEAFFRVMIEEIEPHLGHPKPIFLTGWPASMASLARLDEEGLADRFEAYVDGVELCNGFGELTCPIEQRDRLERDQAARRAAGRDVYPLDERFLAALEQGMPPSGGNALGVDRLVMLLTGATRIDDVLAIPHARL